jgi:hypothetical protein
VTKSVGAA